MFQGSSDSIVYQAQTTRVLKTDSSSRKDLSTLAPDIEEFMKGFMVDIKDVDEIMCLRSAACFPFALLVIDIGNGR